MEGQRNYGRERKDGIYQQPGNLHRPAEVPPGVVVTVSAVSVADPAQIRKRDGYRGRAIKRSPGGFLRLSEEQPVADPLPDLLLILFGPLTPDGALGNHGVDQSAEQPDQVALVFGREFSAQPPSAGRLAND